LFGAAEGLLQAVDAPVYDVIEPNRSLYERTKNEVRSRLAEPTFRVAWSEGRAMTLEQAVNYALERDEAAPH
jgi:hypothetical protein